MKRFLYALLAALALTGCQKAISDALETGLVFTSEKPATRTEWNGETIIWSAGDAISVAYAVSGEWIGPNLYPSTPLAQGGETAQFTVPGNFPRDLVGAHHFYAIYPAVDETDFSDAPDVYTTVPEIQTPKANSYDPAADIMVAESCDYRSLPSTPIALTWTRITAHADISLKNINTLEAETAQSVTLQAQSGAELTGPVIVDLHNPEEFASNGSPHLTVRADNISIDKNNEFHFWASILPVTLTELTVTLETDKATYRKTFSGIEKTFTKNARNILGINMSGATRTSKQQYYTKVTAAPDDWTGDYLVVYEDGKKAFNGGLTTLDAVNNTISVTISDGKILKTEATDAARFTIATTSDGYSIKAASGKFIGQGSNSNGLTTSDQALKNQISYNGSSVDIVGSGGAYLRYNAANDQARFRYFKSSSYTGQKAIQLYKLEGGGSGSQSETPSVTTVGASNITQYQATLNASFKGISTLAAPQDVGFYIGTSTSNMSFVGNIAVSGDSGTYSVIVPDLTPGQKYYFYATMSVWNPETNSYQTIIGETKEFTTKSSGTVTTDLEWAELPALNYTHITSGGNYYIDNNHYSLYQDGSLYVAHHWTTVSSGDGHYRRNYTTCWSSEYKCPLWVAAPLHSSYNGNAKRKDNYKADPDIPSSIQYAASSSGNIAYTRGHMLASNQRLLTQDVNNQVFYYTNIAPQASYMNGGGTGWNNLEDYIMGEKGSGGFNCADTLYVVIGNYFENYTDGNGVSATKKRDTFMGSNVQIPTMLYVVALRTKRGNLGKSVKDCSADELQCAAFCRSQNTGNNGRAVSANDMITVAQLEQLTGFTFFANVPNAPKTIANASDWGL